MIELELSEGFNVLGDHADSEGDAKFHYFIFGLLVRSMYTLPMKAVLACPYSPSER